MMYLRVILLESLLVLLVFGCKISSDTGSAMTTVKVSVEDAAGQPAHGIGIRLQDQGWGFSDDWIAGGVTNSQGTATVRYEDQAGCLVENYIVYAGFELDFDLSDAIPCGEDSALSFTLPLENQQPDTLLIWGKVYNSSGDPDKNAVVKVGRSELVDYRDGIPVWEDNYFLDESADEEGRYRIETVLSAGCGWARYIVRVEDQAERELAFSFYCHETDSVHQDIQL